ncbi:MAG TPA: protein-methionine-sulfoxide reductase catalytic subunit MsrP [Bauldia sp.]
MTIRTDRGWDIPESRATPESIFLNRRALMIGVGAIAGTAIGGLLLNRGGGNAVSVSDPSRGLYPAARNVRYAADRPISPEGVSTTYNNFLEFGASKQIAEAAAGLVTRPWQLSFGGLVEKEFTLGIDDLLQKVDLEERVYRHRCVEGWSMVVPWTGVPLKTLVDLARPLGSAKYLRMEAFDDPAMASGQRQVWYAWPYVEALTMAEATNELAFMVTGAYGNPLAKSMGAPLRVHLPWKYGFKSIKSIVRFSFVEERPATFWPQIDASAYGFWANVNPDVSNRGWSQASERDIATGEMHPTQMFNGYGAYVAGLYAGMDDEPLYL